MEELYEEAYLKGKETAVDTEFDVRDTSRIALMSYSWGPGIRRVVRGDLVKRFFGDWLTDPQTRLVYQNYKADRGIFIENGINVDASFYADIMVTSWLHDETTIRHDLKTQAEQYLKHPEDIQKPWKRLPYSVLFSYVPEGKKLPLVMTPSQVLYDLPPDALRYAVVTPGVRSRRVAPTTAPRTAAEWFQLMIDYSGDDAESTIMLHAKHKRYLKSIGYWSTYLNLDRPYTMILLAQSERGVLLDKARLRTILRKMDVKIMRAERVFRALAGNPTLNLRSPQQMQELLIDEWGWPVREDFRTPTGAATYWQVEDGTYGVLGSTTRLAG
jgi:DNA polymerase I-like protein with 3'-5' exonuclease and polymerase domains